MFNCHCLNLTHHIVEDEARVRQLEVFDQTVELPAVQCAPRTVEVVSGLGLLPHVVVVLELDRKTKSEWERDQKELSTESVSMGRD